MKKVTLESGITKTFNDIVLTAEKGVYDHQYKNDRRQVEMKQVVTTTYPSARANNGLGDSLFKQEDFGFGEGKSFDETRITWMEVPLNVTLEEVQNLLDNAPSAMIQKHLASKPILTPDQQRIVVTGITEKNGNKVSGQEIYDKIERSQRVRNSDEDLVDISGDIIEEDADGNVAPEDQSRVQYRALYFKEKYTEDIDTRVKPNDERVSIATAGQALEAIQANKSVEAEY